MDDRDTPSPPPAGDYEAIEAAVMETEKGRWFLAEFARRNRAADTEAVLAAVSRLERLLQNGPRPAVPTVEAQPAPAATPDGLVFVEKQAGNPDPLPAAGSVDAGTTRQGDRVAVPDSASEPVGPPAPLDEPAPLDAPDPLAAAIAAMDDAMEVLREVSGGSGARMPPVRPDPFDGLSRAERFALFS